MEVVERTMDDEVATYDDLDVERPIYTTTDLLNE